MFRENYKTTMGTFSRPTKYIYMCIYIYIYREIYHMYNICIYIYICIYMLQRGPGPQLPDALHVGGVVDLLGAPHRGVVVVLHNTI